MDGPLSSPRARVVGLLCRTSERDAGAFAGTRALAEAVAGAAGVEARLVGAPGEVAATTYQDDLRDGRGCLLEAGGQLADAFHDGDFPVVCAGTCSVSASTLRVLARDRPDAFVLWLDAHGDFNSPATSPSRFLGGMCLAAACGVWNAGLPGPDLDPTRVVMCGVRDVDAGEQVLLETHGVSRIERPSRLADALAGRDVFVHLDLDVLDPSAMDGFGFPVPGGFSAEGLTRLLADVARVARVAGIEVAGCPGPEAAPVAARCVAPLLS